MFVAIKIIFIVQNSVKKIEQTKGRQTFVINLRVIISFRDIGCVYRLLEQLPTK